MTFDGAEDLCLEGLLTIRASHAFHRDRENSQYSLARAPDIKGNQVAGISEP